MFDWLESTPVAFWVKESWGWPFALTIHAFGSATIVGFSLVMCMCMLGVFKELKPSSLRKLIPFIWFCFGLQVASGVLMWLPVSPASYLCDWWFDAKLALIGIGIAITSKLGRALPVDAGGLISDGRIPLVAVAPLVWIAVSIVAAVPLYATDYSGRYVTSYVPPWSLPLVVAVLGAVLGVMYVLNKKT